MSNSEQEMLNCPKCGSEHFGPYALLGHIFTTHYVVDDGEVGGGESDGE